MADDLERIFSLSMLPPHIAAAVRAIAGVDHNATGMPWELSVAWALSDADLLREDDRG